MSAQRKPPVRVKKGFIDLFIRALEKAAIRNHFFAKAYIGFFRKMTIDEFKMVELPKGSKVVNIGCGSLPHTLIILADIKDWKLIGVDRDKNAVENAQKIVDKYKLSYKISIKWSEGIEFDASEVDLIILSHGIEPKHDILIKMSDTMKNSSKILYRTTWDSLDKIYGKEDIPDTLASKQIYYRIDGIKSCLLMKKNK